MATIACIDDDQVVLNQYELVFKKRGHKVLVGHNGFDLGCFIADENVDAIVLDLAMPGLDGMTSVKRFAVSKPYILQKIVIVSGALTDPIRAELESLGVKSVGKPCDFDELVREVEARCGARLK